MPYTLKCEYYVLGQVVTSLPVSSLHCNDTWGTYEIIFHVPLQSHSSTVKPQDSFPTSINIVFHLSHPWWLCSISGVLIYDPCKSIPRAMNHTVSSNHWECLFNFKTCTWNRASQCGGCYSIYANGVMTVCGYEIKHPSTKNKGCVHVFLAL